MNKTSATKIIMWKTNYGLIILAVLAFAITTMPFKVNADFMGGYISYYNDGRNYYMPPVPYNYNYNYQNNQYPTVQLTADNTSLNYNEGTVLRWYSNYANYCNANGGTNGWYGNKNLSGTFSTGSLNYTTTFNITCTNSLGSSNASVTVYVNNNQNYYPYQYQPNTNVTISADRTNIGYNESTVIRWYPINATSCTGSGGSNGWAGTKSTFSPNSFNTGPLFYTTTYTISCNNYNNYNSYNYYNNYNNNGYSTSSVTVFVGGNQAQTNNSLTATTNEATQIGDTSAQLNSTITNSGNDLTNSWFEWGRTINLGAQTAKTSVGTSSSFNNTFTLSELSPGTTYYFRAVAENSLWRNVGSILSFTTTGQNRAVITREPITPAPTSLVLITSSVDRNQPITPTLDNTKPHPGDQINYKVSYQNIGNASVTRLTLQITLPQEVTYMSSNPSNPSIFGNNLVFNLGTLKANSQGDVEIKVLVQNNVVAGTDLNFPATLSYIDSSGQPQSVNANVSAQVWSEPEPTTVNNTAPLGANVFGAGFFPTNLFEWLILIILVLFLILLVRYLFENDQFFLFRKQTITMEDDPSGKKTTTTTIHQ